MIDRDDQYGSDFRQKLKESMEKPFTPIVHSCKPSMKRHEMCEPCNETMWHRILEFCFSGY